jgi:hypothetical protein
VVTKAADQPALLLHKMAEEYANEHRVSMLAAWDHVLCTDRGRELKKMHDLVRGW